MDQIKLHILFVIKHIIYHLDVACLSLSCLSLSGPVMDWHPVQGVWMDILDVFFTLV